MRTYMFLEPSHMAATQSGIVSVRLLVREYSVDKCISVSVRNLLTTAAGTIHIGALFIES
jgi:hypothetical protein